MQLIKNYFAFLGFLLSTQGSVSRLWYIFCFMMLGFHYVGAVSLLSIIFMGAGMLVHGPNFAEWPMADTTMFILFWVYLAILMVLYLFMLWSSICLYLKRLTDLDQGCSMIMYLFIPIVGQIILLYLLLWPGYGVFDFELPGPKREKLADGNTRRVKPDLKQLARSASRQPDNLELWEDYLFDAVNEDSERHVRSAGRKLFTVYLAEQKASQAFAVWQNLTKYNIRQPNESLFTLAGLLGRRNKMGEAIVVLEHLSQARFGPGKLVPAAAFFNRYDHGLARRFIEDQLRSSDLDGAVRDQLGAQLSEIGDSDSNMDIGIPLSEQPIEGIAMAGYHEENLSPEPAAARPPVEEALPGEEIGGTGSPLKVFQIMPLTLAETGIRVVTTTGKNQTIPFKAIKGIAAGIIRQQGSKSYPVIDLVLPLSKGVQQVARIPWLKINTDQLVPQAPGAKQAFRYFLNEVRQKADALALPDDRILSGSYDSFGSLTEFEQAWGKNV